MQNAIAIIGAGVAGLAAARRLRQRGAAVVLFEKSRGIGGRMATGRVGDLQFDHGAQYFTAKGPRFQEAVAGWEASRNVAPWFGRSYVGTPGMTAPASAMAEGLPVVTECQVSSIRRNVDGWSVLDADGIVRTPGNGCFSAIVLVVPSPQAAPLANSAGVAFPEIERARYAPCWALMLAFATPLDLPGDRIKPEDRVIGWIARNASKPGRAQAHETIVVHATPEWSRAHLEESREEVARRLLARFQTVTGQTRAPTFVAAHRWRYALVEEPAGTPFVWDAASRLGACGDWCLGPRVEAAFDSGEALAEAVLTPS
jgi:renalase